MKYPYRDASFVVRIWWETSANLTPKWRGQVIHTHTQQSRFVDDISSLLDFFERWSGMIDPQNIDVDRNEITQNG